MTGGTLHSGEMRAREHWRAVDSPHLLPYGMVLRRGASLSIEPCAWVRVGAARSLRVEAGAMLDARGEALRPIVLERLERGSWVGVEIDSGVDRRSALAFVEVAGAGADAAERSPAALSLGAEEIVLQRVRLTASAAWGVWVRRGGSFARGSSLSVEGAALGVALVDDVNDAADLPLNALSHNARDVVMVSGVEPTLRRDSVWGGRGVDYAVRDGARLRVEGGASPRLTLLPGTTLQFGRDSALDVGVSAPGAIWIDGVDGGAPVILRGEGDASASWIGVTLGPQIDLSRSAFRGVLVRGAGAPTGAARTGCGCEPRVRGDASMLTLMGEGIEEIVSNVLLERGFSRGVGVVRGGVSGSNGLGLVASGRVGVVGAAVACAELAPLRPGGCVVR